jgi:hypothetical protein
MKKSYRSLLLIIILSFLIAGCGGGDQPGSPGSHGDTGIIIDATVAPKGSDDVDAFQEVCSPGPPPTLEKFTEHLATVTINARLENPDLSITPGNLYIEKFTIDFVPSNDSLGGPPIPSFTGYTQITIQAPTGTGTTTVTQDVMLIDLPRKNKYSSDMLSGAYSSALGSTAGAFINNYTAIYTFYGKNDYGDSFSFQTHVLFVIGNFDLC